MMRIELRLCVVLTLAAIVNHCSAASYQFVNIVDDTGPTRGIFGRPAINNSGTVAFRDNFDAGGSGIFIGSGVAITTLYDTSGPFNNFDSPDINDNGTVAFSAVLDAGGGFVAFTGNGGPTTPVAGVGPINNQGAVAFNTFQGVFVDSGGLITTIADSSGPFGDHFFGVTSFNDSGTVGFSGRLEYPSGQCCAAEGIFIGNGGPVTTVALSGENQPYAQVVQVNNAGTVAFQAGLHELGNYAEAIYIGSPGSLTTIADTYGPYLGFFPYIGLNNNGQVAFKADLDDGGEGIFTGPDPQDDKIIQLSDILFDSNVTSLGFYGALNDNGEIAFRYELANGISGIAVARPVQPLVGDYNLNGSVDAADYVVWRKNAGSQSEYDTWRANFGLSAAGPSLPSDFNQDGTVDAADYVVWRKGLGTIYTQDDYNTWQANFGATLATGSGATGGVPSGSSANPAIPEPSAVTLILCAAVGTLAVPCRWVAAKNRC